MFINRIFIVLILMVISGCDSTWNSGERFKIVELHDGRNVRLDTKTGSIKLITEHGLTELPTEQTQLISGKLYKLSNGELVQYDGDRKFSEDLNALVKKYSSK